MRDGPLAPRRPAAGATTGRASPARRAPLPPMTAVAVAALGGVALGAAGTAALRQGRGATLAAFGLCQLALGLALLVAGLVVVAVAQLLLGLVAQLLLLAPLADPGTEGGEPTRGWARSGPAAGAAVGLCGLLVGIGVSTGRAWVHRPGPGPSVGHTLLLGYAVPVELAVVLVAMVAAIGAAVAVRDHREAAEVAAVEAHRRRVAAQRARAAQRAAARAARRGLRP